MFSGCGVNWKTFIKCLHHYYGGSFCYKYSQWQIDDAWTKMEKKEWFYVPLDNQVGCWPQNTIPYTMRSGFSASQVDHINNHIYQIQNRTCLRWVKIENVTQVRKHVEFVHSEKDPYNCLTAERGTQQYGIVTRIILGDECFESTESAIHEMLHALGFLHEHQRIDRDCYVTVTDRIPNSDIPFKIIYNDFTFEKWPYDKRSITHYARMTGLRDKDEPEFSLWRYRLGDKHGPWYSAGKENGKLTSMDVHKINYRFCGVLDFCEYRPDVCEQIEEEEVKSGCKELYLDIAMNKAIPSDDEPNNIKNHFDQFQNKTCVRWIEKDRLVGVQKFVEFHKARLRSDCYTQEFIHNTTHVILVNITLGKSCFKWEAAIHEMMHALGFDHEHQRIDRDCYVIVRESLARSHGSFKINQDFIFEKWPYDKRSVLHYSRQSGVIYEIDEPLIVLKHQLGDRYGWRFSGHSTGVLTGLDVHKLKYRFCGAPDFCGVQPGMCELIDEEEVKKSCKKLYEDIVLNRTAPSE